MNQLSATLRLDVRLQARSQLYAIGIFVAIALGLIGRFFAPVEYAGRLLTVFYFAGLGSTTYMMSASLVLMEKSQGTLQALRTTPLTANAYIASKVITLTSFALLESAIVYVVAFLGAPVNPALMSFGVVSLGMLYTLVGLGQVASHDSVTAFLFPGAVLANVVLQLPVLYVVLGPNPFWYIIPTQGSFLVMLGATETLDVGQWVYAIAASSLSVLAGFWWARRRFSQFIALQEG